MESERVTGWTVEMVEDGNGSIINQTHHCMHAVHQAVREGCFVAAMGGFFVPVQCAVS